MNAINQLVLRIVSLAVVGALIWDILNHRSSFQLEAMISSEIRWLSVRWRIWPIK